MCPATPVTAQSRGYVIPIGGAEAKRKDPVILERYVKKQANTHPVALHGRRHDGVLEGQARGERARRAGHDISDVAVRVHDGSLVDRATSSSWVMAAESGFVLCRETPGGPLRGEAPVAGGARAELTRGDAGGREGFE